MPNWTGKWAGGRTYQTSDGRTVWVLRKMVDRRPYSITLDVNSEKEAEAELALFRRDPEAYRTRTQVRQEERAEAASKAMYLDAETAGRFLEYLLTEKRTPKYVKDTRLYLAQWADALGGRDLREVEPQQVKRLLGSWSTARQKRIAAFKAFCSFLEEEGLLDPNQDPSRALKVPPSRPEKAVREKGYTMEQVEQLYRAIHVQAVRDVLCLHAKTGMHGTEIERLARGEGKITVLDRARYGEIAATIRFTHKTGRQHTLSIDTQAFAAAQRLQVRGRAPADRWSRHVLDRACEKLGLGPFRFGELRHSFVAWALEHGEHVSYSGKGVPLAAVASVLGHHSTTTTQMFYNVSKVPFMVRVPLRLEHPEDPGSAPDVRAG